MAGYSALFDAHVAPIRFVFDSTDEQDLVDDLQKDISKFKAAIVFVDGARTGARPQDVIGDAMANVTGNHAPYGQNWWLQFVDDLSGAAQQYSSLVVFVNDGHVLLKRDTEFFFRIIEAVFSQYRSWVSVGKPCVTCLQMQSDPVFSKFFREQASRSVKGAA